MRVAILETVKTSAGFEQEFDRLVFDELKKEHHDPILFLPENSNLPVDFGVPIEYLNGGEIIDYEGVGKLKKIFLSIKREYRRVKWFNSAYEKAKKGEIDAIILTTATYRYLRSLHRSKLKYSPVPVVFIFLGVNPQEKPKFVKEAYKCKNYPNIKLKVTSLRNDFVEYDLDNLEIINPPVLVPYSISVLNESVYREPIRIGFFGHYRKGEKDIEGIIRAFLKANASNKAHLVVQAVPTTEEDKKSLDYIVNKYKNQKGLEFFRQKLYGKEWYDAIQSIDVMFLPYSNERYLYNWSAVYFNALGLFKPSITTKYLNPEIMLNYNVGLEADFSDQTKLTHQLTWFIENYEKNIVSYNDELARFNKEYSVKVFLNKLLD